MKKILTLAVVVIASVCVMAGCSKGDTKASDLSNPGLSESKKDMNLIAEITTNDTYDRLELLNLGNIYESEWNNRHFKKGVFQFDVNYTWNIFNSQFSILDCSEDSISIKTDEGDTVLFYNIVSSGNIISFDMLRDDDSVAHFKFTTDLNVDFASEMMSLKNNTDTKGPAILAVVQIISKAHPAIAIAVGVATLAYMAYREHCNMVIENGITHCNEYLCSAYRGRCCVSCTGGEAHPNCKHVGDVYGEGSDCNKF